MDTVSGVQHRERKSEHITEQLSKQFSGVKFVSAKWRDLQILQGTRYAVEIRLGTEHARMRSL